MSLRTSVVLRAANQNSNDCQWQSYLDLCNAGVAIRFSLGMHRNRNCHCEPVVLRAANQNLNDCQWQSYLNVAHAGVALSKDSLRSQSPGTSENHNRTCRGRCPHRPSNCKSILLFQDSQNISVLIPPGAMFLSRQEH